MNLQVPDILRFAQVLHVLNILHGSSHAGNINSYNLADICSTSLVMENEVIPEIKLYVKEGERIVSSWMSYHCDLTVVAPEHHRLLFTLSPYKTDIFCSVTIEVFNSDEGEICGITEEKQVVSNDNMGYLRFNTRGGVIPEYYEFYVSAFYEPPFGQSCATADMYQCFNWRCVDTSLLCNWRDNCGDESDERECKIRIVIISVFSSFGLLMAICVFIRCRAHRKRRLRLQPPHRRTATGPRQEHTQPSQHGETFYYPMSVVQAGHVGAPVSIQTPIVQQQPILVNPQQPLSAHPHQPLSTHPNQPLSTHPNQPVFVHPYPQNPQPLITQAGINTPPNQIKSRTENRPVPISDILGPPSQTSPKESPQLSVSRHSQRSPSRHSQGQRSPIDLSPAGSNTSRSPRDSPRGGTSPGRHEYTFSEAPPPGRRNVDDTNPNSYEYATAPSVPPPSYDDVYKG